VIISIDLSILIVKILSVFIGRIAPGITVGRLEMSFIIIISFCYLF